MSKRLLFLAVIIVAVFAFVGCSYHVRGDYVRGSGGHVSVNPQLASDFAFNAINVNGHFDVEFQSRDSFGYTLTAQENLHDYISINLRGNTLYVSTTRNIRTSSGNTPRIVLQAPYINNINIVGAANIQNWDALYTDTLDITITGAGNISLHGEVNNLDITLSGAGSIDTSKLFANDATVRLNGAGRVILYANETLYARLNGVGHITYYGSASVERRGGGVGRIRSGN